MLTIVVARTVKEAPDCEPQCGVGMGGSNFAFTSLPFSRDGDVMIVMAFALEHACVVYFDIERVGEINDARTILHGVRVE